MEFVLLFVGGIVVVWGASLVLLVKFRHGGGVWKIVILASAALPVIAAGCGMLAAGRDGFLSPVGFVVVVVVGSGVGMFAWLIGVVALLSSASRNRPSSSSSASVA